MGDQPTQEGSKDLASLLFLARQWKQSIQERGRKAFERGDAREARREAEKLELIGRIQELIEQLNVLLEHLDDLGLSTGSEDGPEQAQLTSASIAPVQPKARTRASATWTAEAFKPYVLESLRELGGESHVAAILASVGSKIRPRLGPGDLEKMENHNCSRWEYRVRWALTSLKHDRIVTNPRRGIWRLIPPQQLEE